MHTIAAMGKEASRFLPTDGAAAYLNARVGNDRSYTPASLKALRRKQKGPPYYRGLGRGVLYAVPDLDLYIQSCRVDPEMRA